MRLDELFDRPPLTLRVVPDALLARPYVAVGPRPPLPGWVVSTDEAASRDVNATGLECLADRFSGWLASFKKHGPA
jgi:hypothetical protein